jgi:hypothetical protein
LILAKEGDVPPAQFFAPFIIQAFVGGKIAGGCND